jgi:hypothetical protein
MAKHTDYVSRLKTLFSLRFEDDMVEECRKEFEESGMTPEQWVETNCEWEDNAEYIELVRRYAGLQGICPDCEVIGQYHIEWFKHKVFDGVRRCICPKCGVTFEETHFCT